MATMWDVVEHLRDPKETLATVGRHLATDGLIFIETGNFENWRRVVEKDRWGLYLFDHQFHFSPSSLKQVLCDAGYNGFCLLNCNGARPSIHPKQVFRQPLQLVRSWFEWARAKAKWPEHGDINVMGRSRTKRRWNNHAFQPAPKTPRLRVAVRRPDGCLWDRNHVLLAESTLGLASQERQLSFRTGRPGVAGLNRSRDQTL